jgi:hypothetical protein
MTTTGYMSVQRYYRAAIWLPIALPSMCWLGVRLFGNPVWETLEMAVVALILSLVYGGIPYAVVAAWATWHTRAFDERALRRFAWRAPLLMLLAFLPYAFVFSAFDGYGWKGGLFVFVMGAPYILVLGYAYVALVLGVGLLLIRRPAPLAGLTT